MNAFTAIHSVLRMVNTVDSVIYVLYHLFLKGREKGGQGGRKKLTAGSQDLLTETEIFWGDENVLELYSDDVCSNVKEISTLNVKTGFLLCRVLPSQNTKWHQKTRHSLMVPQLSVLYVSDTARVLCQPPEVSWLWSPM